MQAIETKYIAPANTKGARIKATCARGSITVGYSHELSHEECHVFAANVLVRKLMIEDQKKYGTAMNKNPWAKPRVSGSLKNGNHVHVFPS